MMTEARHAGARPFYLQLWFLVLVAMAAGIALGELAPDVGAQMEPLATAFIKAIRVLIAPIIATALFAHYHSGYAIAIFIAGCAVISLVSASFMPDYSGQVISAEYDD